MQIIPVWGFYIVEISTFQQSSLLARPKYTYYNGYLTITLHYNNKYWPGSFDVKSTSLPFVK